MNLTHSYAAPKPKNYAGIGLVVALHLAGIYALSAGLIKPAPRPHEATVLLPPVAEKQPDPPPSKLAKYTPPAPSTINVPIPEVPVPSTWIETPQVAPQPLTSDMPTPAGPAAGVASANTAQPPLTIPTGIQSPGAVCAVMPRPDVPTLSWTGEAVLHVVATVRGGRVVGTEFSVLQGALDAKTKRALQRSAEAALAAYQCQGDASFQQDFAFRLE